MLRMSFRWRMDSQRYDLRREASTIWALDPFRTIGRTCLKSPPRTTVFPPNGRCDRPIISRRLLSSASTFCLFVIDVLSQIIRAACCSNLAVPLCFVKLHQPPSWRVRGILKHEWVVIPPGIMATATLDVAVATTSLSWLCSFARSALYKKVFPVPPGPSTKNNPPYLL
jgi:hypothetical protein